MGNRKRRRLTVQKKKEKGQSNESERMDIDSESDGAYVKSEDVTPELSESNFVVSQLSGKNPEEILLRIPVVLDKILKHLSCHDLCRFRKTSSVWKKIISTHLLKTVTPEIIFEHKSVGSSSGEKTLDEFLDCFSKSEILPCNNFCFYGTENFNTWTPFKQFFTRYGHQIKKLQLGLQSQSSLNMDMKTLRSIFLSCPNLESLEMGHIPGLKWNDSNRLTLPSLKSLTCLSDKETSTVFEMIGKAPKLAVVNCLKIKYIQSFLSQFKVDLIQSIESLYSIEESDVQNLLTLANAKPRLSVLCLPVEDYDFSVDVRGVFIKAVNRILESSKDSLQQFGAFDLSADGLEFPQLKNVKKLDLYFNRSTRPVFQPGMNLSEIFPNVTYMFWYLPGKIQNWENIIPLGPTVGTLSKVKRLRVDTADLASFLNRISVLTPNVTSLSVCGTRQDFVDDLWGTIHTNYPNLTQIVLRDSQKYLLPFFTDSALTGIPERTCRMLRRSTGEMTQNLNELKTRVGISDFRYLKTFVIFLKNDVWNEKVISRSTFPTRVSMRYGFAYAGYPQVLIGFNEYCPSATKIKSALSSIGFYAEIVHFKHPDFWDT